MSKTDENKDELFTIDMKATGYTIASVKGVPESEWKDQSFTKMADAEIFCQKLLDAHGVDQKYKPEIQEVKNKAWWEGFKPSKLH